MLPSQLREAHFASYPPEARKVAVEHVTVLRELPLVFLAVLLRELIAYDWKFPAEKQDLDHQLSYLSGVGSEELKALIGPFMQIRVPRSLENTDWVDGPRQFSEQLTAHLWATHQIDAFREAALAYGQKIDATMPPEPFAMPRLGIVMIGRGVAESKYALFRKLRPWGVYFKQVHASNGVRVLLDNISVRAEQHAIPFAHWYIDGAACEPSVSTRVTRISYGALHPIRNAIVSEMQKAVQEGSGPEALRTKLAQMSPTDVGLNGGGNDSILNHFQLSLLTEGSGTQLFSTSLVQWSAREALRRARPLTLLARFAPRQRERSMNELIAKPNNNPELDPQGSLIDADMGAYYTWINLQRLPGAERSSFLVWFEDHGEALAIGPSLPRGTESSSPITMERLLQEIT